MEQEPKLGRSLLITGHRGFVGKNLFQFFLKKGFDVSGIDRKEDDDLTDLNLARRIFKRNQPNYVFHLAATTQVEEGLGSPKECFENNIKCTINICELAREFGFKLIHMSTDKVYGDGPNKIESASLIPTYPYDVSKLCCEEIIQSYKNTYGMNLVIARSCNIYGDNDDNYRRIIPCLMEARKTGTLEIRSNGNLRRDYIHISDEMEALRLIMDRKGIFNISSGENLSVMDIVNQANSTFKKKVKYVILNRVENELAHQSLNFNKLKGLGFKPKMTMIKFLGELK